MDEANYLETYLGELSGIAPCSDMEIRHLLNDLAIGDESAVNRLIEGNMYLVIDVVQDYEAYGYPVADLIQEGNMALVETVMNYGSNKAALTGDGFIAYLKRIIEEKIKALLKEQEVEDAAGVKLAREANRLLEVTKDFEEQYDRAATLKELSELMDMSESDIEYLIRISKSAMDMSVPEEQNDPKPASDPMRNGWEM